MRGNIFTARRVSLSNVYTIANGGHFGQDGNRDFGRSACAEKQAHRAVQLVDFHRTEIKHGQPLASFLIVGTRTDRADIEGGDLSASSSARSSSLGSWVRVMTALLASSCKRNSKSSGISADNATPAISHSCRYS